MKPEDIASINRVFDVLEDFATKADASGMKVRQSPAMPARPASMTIEVSHGPGKDSKDAAIARAHAVAADHGYDPRNHEVGGTGPNWSSDSGANHTTAVSYTKPC